MIQSRCFTPTLKIFHPQGSVYFLEGQDFAAPTPTLSPAGLNLKAGLFAFTHTLRGIDPYWIPIFSHDYACILMRNWERKLKNVSSQDSSAVHRFFGVSFVDFLKIKCTQWPLDLLWNVLMLVVYRKKNLRVLLFLLSWPRQITLWREPAAGHYNSMA